MIKWLLSHQWKEKLRSPFWQKSIGINLVLGFFAIWIIINAFVLGIYVNEIILEFYPNSSPFKVFNVFIFWYLIVDLFMRFFAQKFPAMTIKPYLHLPIKKNQVFNYLLWKSVPHFFNILPLFILIPFLIKTVIPEFGMGLGMIWFGSIFLLILFNNFLSYFINKFFNINPTFTIGLLILFGGLFYIDFYGYFSISSYFGQFMSALVSQPYLIAVPFLALIGVIFILKRLFSGHAYLENIEPESSNKAASTYTFGILDRFGTVGELIQLELKLIQRNKRPKTMAMMSIILILYPLFFVSQGDEIFNSTGFRIFLGIFVTGAFMINYGQLLLAWESTYFDFILARKIRMKEFFEAKYYMFFATNFMTFILTLPYAFYDPSLILLGLATVLFNTGVNAFVILFFATFNSKRVDLKKGAFFNYEGIGAQQFLLMLPLLLLPILIYAPFGFSGHVNIGIIILGLLGIVGIIFRNVILNGILHKFEERKYKMAAGFRKQ